MDREITDYRGPSRGLYRVSRGGSWDRGAESCRSADRGNGTPDSRSGSRGFRLALSPE